MKASRLLVAALRDPASVASLSVDDWTMLLTAARAERLIGTLAHRLDRRTVPPAVARILADAREGAVEERRAALWEAEMARRALLPLDIPVVLLKGTAFAAAGLDAGQGRSIGDLDILVPRAVIDDAERALRAAGWEPIKEDAYDDSYYRRWMHELPPLIHRDRDRMIDVHHTILPPTARPTPDAAALLDHAVPLGAPGDGGLAMLSPADIVVHAAAHLFADGDLSGGLRNLWDIDRLLREYDDPAYWRTLRTRAGRHQLLTEVSRAVRLSAALFGTPIPPDWRRRNLVDALYRRRLLVRDGWGRQGHAFTRLGFYVRSHWLRMPLLMLARHLWTKATRKGA
jgi:hypothetical protein